MTSENNHFPKSPEFIITGDELRQFTLAHGPLSTLDGRLALRDKILARPHNPSVPAYLDQALNEGTGVYSP